MSVQFVMRNQQCELENRYFWNSVPEYAFNFDVPEHMFVFCFCVIESHTIEIKQVVWHIEIESIIWNAVPELSIL